VVDRAPDRLRRAESIGAIAVDFTKGDAVDQIKDLRASNKTRARGLRLGEEKIAGLNCAIDAVGCQARSQKDPDKEDPMPTIRQIAELVNPTGSVGLVGSKIKPSFIVSHRFR
jgi:glutathione-independent formaldehyde dehydrogenase